MNGDKLARLVARLAEKTLAGEIAWEKTSKAGVFQSNFPEYVVRILSRESQDYPNDFDYIVRIYDQAGDMVEEAEDRGLVKGGWDEAYATMKNMYVAARKQAFGVDKAIDALLSELE